MKTSTVQSVNLSIPSEKRCVDSICPRHTVLTNFISKEVGDTEGVSQSSDSGDVPLWPLVIKVRIFFKSDILQAGLIIADLPGTADANVARSAIAKEYMKRAHIVLIVAPVTRAVAESAAAGTSNLLSFHNHH